MSEIILAKTGKRYTRQAWNMLDPNEKEILLTKYGPAYTEEAWKNHYGTRKPGK